MDGHSPGLAGIHFTPKIKQLPRTHHTEAQISNSFEQ